MDQSNEKSPPDVDLDGPSDEFRHTDQGLESSLRAAVQEWKASTTHLPIAGRQALSEAGESAEPATHGNAAKRAFEAASAWSDLNDNQTGEALPGHQQETGAMDKLQDQVQSLLSSLDHLHLRLDQVAEAGTQGHDELRAGLATVKNVEDQTRQWLEAAATALASDVEGGLKRLLTVGESVDHIARYVAGLNHEVREIAVELLASVGNMQSVVEGWQFSIAESAQKTEVRLVAALEHLEHGISLYRDNLSAGLADLAERIESRLGQESTSAAMAELQGKLLETLEAKLFPAVGSLPGEEPLQRLLAELNDSISDWRTRSDQAFRDRETAAALTVETLQSALAESEAGRLEVEQKMVNSLDLLEGRLEQLQQSTTHLRTSVEAPRNEELQAALAANFARQEQLEATTAELVASINHWRDQGRESAARSKERMAASLESLEVRILETHDASVINQELVRHELSSLRTDLERLKVDKTVEGDSIVMRGLEELDENLLETKENLSNLSEEFEAQLDMLENRIADRVSDRLTELERAIRERDRALRQLLAPGEGVGRNRR